MPLELEKSSFASSLALASFHISPLLGIAPLPPMSCGGKQTPKLLAHALLCFTTRWPSSRS
jgi:hypothetical protein